ncbi:MAG: hypothetical protein Q8S84_00200 [bacterium]|nr:hypothetical protein [bacterium]
MIFGNIAQSFRVSHCDLKKYGNLYILIPSFSSYFLLHGTLGVKTMICNHNFCNLFDKS